MRILFFGDIMGKPGRQAVAKVLPKLREEHRPDLVVVNVENLAHGKGVTLKTIEELRVMGADFFTSGNHVFDKPEAAEVFKKYPDQIIRPANLEASDKAFPGDGFRLITAGKTKVLMINLLGQGFMEKQFDLGKITNPFLALNEILAKHGKEAPIQILDFHAEATSEKRAMGLWADGRISLIIGTHTHVPTNDAQVLSLGTGYITDAGMTGAYPSVIGVSSDTALKRFLAEEGSIQKSSLEIPDIGGFEVGYVLAEIDEQSSKCKNIIGRVIFG